MDPPFSVSAGDLVSTPIPAMNLRVAVPNATPDVSSTTHRVPILPRPVSHHHDPIARNAGESAAKKGTVAASEAYDHCAAQHLDSFCEHAATREGFPGILRPACDSKPSCTATSKALSGGHGLRASGRSAGAGAWMLRALLVAAFTVPAVATSHTCGDGIRRGNEWCDDGNTVDGDGCSATCFVESGYACKGRQPDVCSTTTLPQACCAEGGEMTIYPDLKKNENAAPFQDWQNGENGEDTHIPELVEGRNHLTMVDLNGDGLVDAVVGKEDGTIGFAPNSGSPTSPAFTKASYLASTNAGNPFFQKDVGDSARVAFIDLDGDGDMDAVVGNKVGRITYFKNTGSPTAPSFERFGPDQAGNPFNGMDVGTHCAPAFADFNGDGVYDGYFGNGEGSIAFLHNTGSATSPSFVAIHSFGVPTPSPPSTTAHPASSTTLAVAGLVWSDISGNLAAVKTSMTADISTMLGVVPSAILKLELKQSSLLSGVICTFEIAAGASTAHTPAELSQTLKETLSNGNGKFTSTAQTTGKTVSAEVTTITPSSSASSSPSPSPTDGNDNSNDGGNDNSNDGGNDNSNSNFGPDDNSCTLTACPAKSHACFTEGSNDACVDNCNDNCRCKIEPNSNGFVCPAASHACFTDANDLCYQECQDDQDDCSGLLLSQPTLVLLTSSDSPQPGILNVFKGKRWGSLSSVAFGDVDRDGDIDAVIMYTPPGSAFAHSMYFENTGSVKSPKMPQGIKEREAGSLFKSSLHIFFAEAMVSFADLDGNGQLDIFTSDYRNVLDKVETHYDLLAYGSYSSPGNLLQLPFQDLNNPFVNFPELGNKSSQTQGAGEKYMSPACIDIDGDGDVDCFVGTYDSHINFYRNRGSPQKPDFEELTWQNTANPFYGITVHACSFKAYPETPTNCELKGLSFADVNGDGLFDLLVGGDKLAFFKNGGTAKAPDFGSPIRGIFTCGVSQEDLCDSNWPFPQRTLQPSGHVSFAKLGIGNPADGSLLMHIVISKFWTEFNHSNYWPGFPEPSRQTATEGPTQVKQTSFSDSSGQVQPLHANDLPFTACGTYYLNSEYPDRTGHCFIPQYFKNKGTLSNPSFEWSDPSDPNKLNPVMSIHKGCTKQLHPGQYDQFRLTFTDLDMDGDDDIIVSYTEGTTARIGFCLNVPVDDLEGTEKLKFNPDIEVDAKTNPFFKASPDGAVAQCATIDLNGDGDVDVLSANSNGQMEVFESFQSQHGQSRACHQHGVFLFTSKHYQSASYPQMGTCSCAAEWGVETNCNDCSFGRWGGLCEKFCASPFPNKEFSVAAVCNGRGTCSNGVRGSGTCSNCEAPYTGAACSSCNPGFKAVSSASTGTVACVACAAGMFSSTPTATVDTSCAACPVSTITADGKACSRCPYPLVPNNEQTACQPCGDGTRPANGVCVTCPTVDRGLSCNGGKLLLDEGFWFNASAGLTNTSRVIQCVFEGACKVNTSSVNSSQNEAQAAGKLLSTVLTELESGDPVLFCSGGYRGLLCADCISGFYRSKEGCQACPAGAGASLAAIFLAPVGIFTVVCMAVVLCLAARAFRTATQAQEAANNEKVDSVVQGQVEGGMEDAADGGMEDMAAGVHEDAGDTASKTSMFNIVFRIQEVLGNKGKILLSYVQIIVLFRIELPALAWPSYLKGLFSFFSALNLDILQVFPLGCSTESLSAPFATTFAVYVYGALGVLISILLVGLASGAVLFKGPLAPAGRLWRAGCIKWFGIVIFLQYTSICQIIIQTIRPCVAIDDSTMVMRADVTLFCDTPEFISLWWQGALAFWLFCIGVPAILLIALRRNRAVLYCYADGCAVDNVGYFIGGEGDLEGRLLRTVCRTELFMDPPATTSAEVVTPTAGRPYTLLEIENEDADDETTIFKFTDGLTLIKTHDKDCKTEAAHLAFGWVSSNYDSAAYWFEPWEFTRKLILTIVAIFGATDANLQIVYALIVCTLCLLFQAEMQPYADAGDDFLGAVSLACLSMTLTVGLGLAVPTSDQTVRWMLELLAVLVSVFAFLLGIYQLVADTRDEFMDKKDAADASASKCWGCCGRRTSDSESSSRASADIAEVRKAAKE